jgi:catechol 2,3-dioxygenase
MNRTPITSTLAPSTSPLGSSLQLAPSQLLVANLHAMTTFYHDQVGLEILSKYNDVVTLGDQDLPIIELVQAHNLSVPAPGSAGLFHNAVVYQSQTTLSKRIGRLLQMSPQLFTGTGDHLVSEAFYFNDPEGNGLELYFDRPADTWQWHDGRVVMDTLYIDPIEYVMKHSSNNLKESQNHKLGHIHLRVGNIEVARRFYVDILGFDITADLGSALFVSIGGYHHHIGLNTWLSADAPKRSPSLGLSEVTITLQSDINVGAVAQCLEQNSCSFKYTAGKLRVADPWGNQLVFQST